MKHKSIHAVSYDGLEFPEYPGLEDPAPPGTRNEAVRQNIIAKISDLYHNQQVSPMRPYRVLKVIGQRVKQAFCKDGKSKLLE